MIRWHIKRIRSLIFFGLLFILILQYWNRLLDDNVVGKFLNIGIGIYNHDTNQNTRDVSSNSTYRNVQTFSTPSKPEEVNQDANIVDIDNESKRNKTIKELESFKTTKKDVEITTKVPHFISNIKSTSQHLMQQHFSELEKEMQNIPLLFMFDAESKSQKLSNNEDNMKKECEPKVPNIYKINYNNIYWQKYLSKTNVFYLYGAYLDNRRRAEFSPTIKILAMIDGLPNVKINNFCQMWFIQKDSIHKDPYQVTTMVKSYKNINAVPPTPMESVPGYLNTYILTCYLPKDKQDQVPVAVSLVRDSCEQAKNLLKVIYNKIEPKKDFAVCLRGLSFPTYDISIKLVEWIETLSLVGVDKIFFYRLSVHPNIQKTIDYYVEKGKAEFTHITLPGFLPNEKDAQAEYLQGSRKNAVQRMTLEKVHLNDCILRNVHRYRYIAVIDDDELILPHKPNIKTWNDMLKNIEQIHRNKLKEYSKKRKTFWFNHEKERYPPKSYNFHNVYFMPEMLNSHLSESKQVMRRIVGIPEHLEMSRQVYRSEKYTDSIVKTLHDTRHIVAVDHHYSIFCLEGPCYIGYYINPSIAHLQHYRSNCQWQVDRKICENEYKKNVVKDDTIWKYNPNLIDNSMKVLKELELI